MASLKSTEIWWIIWMICDGRAQRGHFFSLSTHSGVDFSLSTNRDLDFYRVLSQWYILRYFAILWTEPHIVDDTLLSSKVGYIS